MTAEQIISALELAPLIGEGGAFRRNYLSEDRLHSGKPLASAIYYLLKRDTFSRMHRLKSDEVYHFYLGARVELLLLYPDGNGESVYLGTDLLNGERVQQVVPAGTWQGSRIVGEGEFALLGCTVSPAYDQADYEDGGMEELLMLYPKYASLLRILAQPPKY